MKVLLVIPGFTTGGGEIFALRLAQALSIDHEVSVYSLNFPSGSKRLNISHYTNSNLLFREFQLGIFKFIPKILLKGFFLLVFNAFVNFFRRSALKKWMLKQKFDIINSHLIASDFLISSIKDSIEIPWVITMHGSYEHDLTHRVAKKRETLRKASGIVYIAEKNLGIFNPSFPKENFRTKKIYNGFRKPTVSLEEQIKFKEKYSLPKDAFVYVMAARADARKGWLEAILAFTKNDLPNCYFLLVGSGDYMKELESQFSKHKRLIFATNEPSIFPALACSHAGLLPTYYPTESLPNSLSEYLAFDLPCISTDIGDIKLMVQTEHGEAGTILPLEEGKANINQLAHAMKELYINKELYTYKKNLCKIAVEKFDMDACVNQYVSFFQAFLLPH